MSQFTRTVLPLCLFALFVSVASEDQLNSSSPGSLKDIPFDEILKDLHAGLNKPEPGDLRHSESNPGKKIVGVKKHKNYEIVLYEYEGEDSDEDSNDDFDEDQSQPGFRSSDEFLKEPEQVRKPFLRDEYESPPNKDLDSIRTLSKPNAVPQQNPNGKDDTSRSLPEATEGDNPRRTHEQNTTPTPRVLNQRFRRIKTTTGKIDTVKDQAKVEDSEKENSPKFDQKSGQADKVDYSIKSTPFPWLRDSPRGKQPEKIRPVTPRRGGNKDRSSFQRRPVQEDDDQNVFEITSSTPKASEPEPSKKLGRKRIRRPKRPQSGDPDFQQGGPGAGKFKPTRRPAVFEPPSDKFRNRTIVDDIDEENLDEDDPEAGVLCKDPTGKSGICQEYFTCSVLYSNMEGKINLEDYKCKLPNHIGVCCPIVEERDAQGPRGRALMTMFSGKKVISRQIRKLIRSNFNNSIDFGSDSVGQLQDIEDELLTRSIQVTRNTPAFGHNRFFPTSKKIRQVSNIGFELLQTSNDLSDRLQLTNEVGGVGLKNFGSSNTEALNGRCPALKPCGINKYRQLDGSCNNLRKPKMGQSLTPLSRVLEPAYADGRWSPRISVRGFNLPSPRLLSQAFVQDRDNPDNRFTLMVMQFGQFVDHDISSVPIFTFSNNSGISCCRNGKFLPPDLRHPNCMPIEIPENDPFYSKFGQRCMNFVRSRMAPRIDCSLGYADQMNAVTHWLDLSNVYGSNDGETKQLRIFQGGLLKFSELEDRTMLLPLKPGKEINYKAGDDRVNEMQGLMVMHLVWFREHNRVAFELAKINLLWSDEQLFQEARRIVIAEYQHIIYNEWLPIIVGREYMDSYGILPLTRGYFTGYDPEVDASIENSFSSAGFRMGHTLVQGIVKLINELGQDNERVVISQNADNARNARKPNQIDRWIRGLAQQPIQKFDPFISEHLNGRLFQARGGMFGMDLTSLNIQRARDHGVPGYNAFRELCQTGPKATKFEDYKDWIAPEIITKMKRMYAHPDDVDLWIGGIAEAPLPGALIGPTFTCIIGDQFARSKKGDRYFYDLGDQTHSYSPDQLREIRKSSFARILCDNGDELEAVQPSSFLQPDFDFNSLVDCRRSSRISRMNLRLWENEPTP